MVSVSQCKGCHIGFWFDTTPYDDDDDTRIEEKKALKKPVPSGWESLKNKGELAAKLIQYGSCRPCQKGYHTYGTNGTGCQKCRANEAACLGNGQGCKDGHRDGPGQYCSTCENMLEDDTNSPKVGYFRQGNKCELCGNPAAAMIASGVAIFVLTYGLTYFVVKGLTTDNIARVSESLDVSKAASALCGTLQRLTIIFTMQFGWPTWLVEFMYYVKDIVSFDAPSAVSPECGIIMTPPEMELNRLTLAFVAMPAIWTLIFVEMGIIRHFTKMGRRKAARGLSMFGLSWFRSCGCSTGAFENVVVHMHGMFFMSVFVHGLKVMDCMPVDSATPGETVPALTSNPAVYCLTEPQEGWTEDDANVFLAIKTMGW